MTNEIDLSILERISEEVAERLPPQSKRLLRALRKVRAAVNPPRPP